MVPCFDKLFLASLTTLVLGAGCESSPEESAPIVRTSSTTIERQEPTKQVDLVLDWDAARAESRPWPSELDSGLQRRLALVGMPLLLVDDPTLHQTAKVTTGDGWYAVSSRGDGVTVLVQGRRRAFVHPNLAADNKGLDEPVVSESHAIFTVSLRRFGGHYSVDLECDRAGLDARCADADEALALANRLIVVVVPEGGAR